MKEHEYRLVKPALDLWLAGDLIEVLTENNDVWQVLKNSDQLIAPETIGWRCRAYEVRYRESDAVPEDVHPIEGCLKDLVGVKVCVVTPHPTVRNIEGVLTAMRNTFSVIESDVEISFGYRDVSNITNQVIYLGFGGTVHERL